MWAISIGIIFYLIVLILIHGGRDDDKLIINLIISNDYSIICFEKIFDSNLFILKISLKYI